MLNLQLLLIIGISAAAIATNVNLKLLPSTKPTTLETKGNISSSKHNIADKAFVNFLNHISQEQSYTTIVILTNSQYTTAASTTTGAAKISTSQQYDYCVNLKYYMKYFQHQLENQQHVIIPVLLLQSQQSDYTLHGKFNGEFVMIVCVPSLFPLSQRQVITKVTQNHLLRALSKNLLYLRKNRVIMRMDFNSHEGENLENIENILKYCHMEQIINIMIISYQFPHNDTVYYSYEKFPEFKMTKHTWSKSLTNTVGREQLLFPNKLRNLKGYKIYTLPDQIEPRSMVYYDSHGQQQVGGYMANFLKFYAKGINGTLLLPFKVNEGTTILLSDILNFTRNNTVDIPTSLTGPINNTHWSEFSYPFEIDSFCVMIPVEAEISMAEIFSVVLNPYFVCNVLLLFICFTFLLIIVFRRMYSSSYHIYLVDILVNDKALRAILGQCFPFNHQNLDYFAVYITILKDFSSFVVVTLYGIFLGSFITSPPKYPLIKSFADLEKSGIKLLIHQRVYQLIYPRDYLKYPRLFRIVDSYQEFISLRDSLNTTYAYGVTTSRWHIFATQQKRFSRQLFRYSTDLCFNRYLHFYIVLPKHSVFRETLNLYILKSYSSGLFFHWFESSFYELVSLGHMSLNDMTERRQFKPIAVVDLLLIFKGFCILLMLSVVVFIVEILMYRGKTKKLKSISA